nr:hypothetical protein [Tanacetum cinerariifolium]
MALYSALEEREIVRCLRAVQDIRIYSIRDNRYPRENPKTRFILLIGYPAAFFLGFDFRFRLFISVDRVFCVLLICWYMVCGLSVMDVGFSLANDGLKRKSYMDLAAMVKICDGMLLGNDDKVKPDDCNSMYMLVTANTDHGETESMVVTTFD